MLDRTMLKTNIKVKVCNIVGADFFFFFFLLCWVFVAACGLSLAAASKGYSLLRCAGFSLQWLLLLRSMGSRHAGFSSCSTQAQ